MEEIRGIPMTISMQHVKHNPAINWRTTVSPDERAEAVAMWRDGFDTYDIAHALHIRESIIYAGLPQWRKV
jgi:hypothetical protein